MNKKAKGFKRNIKHVSALVVVFLLVSLFAGAETAEGNISRLGGVDRYETSALMAGNVYGYANTVIIARGDPGGHFADGLASSVLAGVLDAPVLLTRPGALPDSIRKVIIKLGATRVIVLGGREAISDSVVGELEKLGLTVNRIGGKDRYETAAKIAEEARKKGYIASYAFIVNGFATADSLVAAPAAFKNGAVILQVARDTIPAVTESILRSLGISQVYIVGGTAVVGSSVENGLSRLATVRRLGGANRYATSVALARELFAGETNLVLACGFDTNLVDSIGACIFGLPVLYVQQNTIPGVVNNFLNSALTAGSRIRIIGGPAAVSQEVNTQVKEIIDDSTGGGGTTRPGPQPKVNFTFTGLDDIIAGTVGFSITTKLADNKAIANNTPLRYKAVITKDGKPLSGQVIKYPEAGDTLEDPNTWHSFTTEDNGVAYFGPSTGFTLVDLPALLSAEGVTTPFQADFEAGSYSVTVSLLNISKGKELVLGSGTKKFSAPEIINFKTPADQFITGYTRPSALYDGTNYHLWYRTYGTSPMKTYHKEEDTIDSLKTATECETSIVFENLSVIKEGGTYYLFSSSSDGTKINVSTSTDGTTWGENKLVFDKGDTGWDSDKIDNPMVMHDGINYKLYYQGRTAGDKYQIGLATSDAIDGKYMAVQNNPILTSGDAEAWDSGTLFQPWVVKDGAFYYMWYAAGNGPQAIGYAWSRDGVNWTKTDQALVTAPSGYYGTPTVIKTGDVWHMWFLHESGGSSNIMYVNSSVE